MNFINYTYMSILLICFLTGLAYITFLQKPIKMIFIYVLVTLITESLGYYYLYIHPDSKINGLIYSYYRPIAYCVLSLFFSKIIHDKTISNIILFLIPCLLSVSIYFIFIGTTGKTNFQFGLLFKGLLVCYSVFYFKQLLKSEEEINSNPNFWIITGILFFNAGFFFLSGFVNYISQKDLELARKLYSINHIINIFYYSLITYGFICQRRLARS